MTEKVLSKEALQKFYFPKLRFDEDESSFYAFGWGVSKTDRNTTQVWHNGSNNIFYANFIRYIDEDVVLIMLSNKSHPNFNSLSFELSKIIFNPDYIPEIPIVDNIINRSFTEKIIKTIEDFGLEKAMQDYQNRKNDEFLLEFLMRENGFNYIDNGKSDIAINIFKINVNAYPNSSKALQGLGEASMETGKNELALKYFRQSLNINPDNNFVIDMIKILEEK